MYGERHRRIGLDLRAIPGQTRRRPIERVGNAAGADLATPQSVDRARRHFPWVETGLAPGKPVCQGRPTPEKDGITTRPLAFAGFFLTTYDARSIG